MNVKNPKRSEPDDRTAAAVIPAAARRPWGALVVAVPSCHHLRMDVDKPICGREPDGQYVELAVEVFGMLADATRVRIILALRDGEMPVNQLAGLVDKSPAATSQHLAKLRMARIVTTRRQGQTIFYSLANEHAKQLVTDAIFQAEHALDHDPRHHHGGEA